MNNELRMKLFLSSADDFIMDLFVDYIPFIFIQSTHNELSILILTIAHLLYNNSNFLNSIIFDIYNTIYITLYKIKYHMHYPMLSSTIMIFVNDKYQTYTISSY